MGFPFDDLPPGDKDQAGAKCFHCGKALVYEISAPGRRDTCPSCGSDVHVCYNCRHYDASAYNECREPQAERVLDKNRSNFCDYFSLGGGKKGSSSDKDKALKDLESLFKK